MKIFCERLKELRLEKGLSTIEVAKAIDVSYTSIIRWEKEERIPSIEQLKALAIFFKVSSDYLLGLED